MECVTILEDKCDALCGGVKPSGSQVACEVKGRRRDGWLYFAEVTHKLINGRQKNNNNKTIATCIYTTNNTHCGNMVDKSNKCLVVSCLNLLLYKNTQTFPGHLCVENLGHYILCVDCHAK